MTTDFHHTMKNPSDVMSPQQAADLLEASAQGDTGAVTAVLESSVPSAAPAVDITATDPAAAPAAPAPAPAAPAPAPAGDPTAAAPAAQVEDPTKTVIQAKDGVHTISYDKLVQARSEAASAKAALAAAQTQLDELNRQAEARAAAGEAPTKTDTNAAAAQAAVDAGVDPSVFGDWSPEAMAKGMQTVLSGATKPLLDRLNALEGHLAQQQEANTQQTARQAYYGPIYAAHPDADSIVQSQELAAWLATKPSFYADVMQTGKQQQVIDFFTEFKKETGIKPTPTPSPGDAARTTAAQAIQQAANAIPNSLTDIPIAARGPTDANELLNTLSGPDLVEALSSMTAQQQQDYINRNS